MTNRPTGTPLASALAPHRAQRRVAAFAAALALVALPQAQAQAQAQPHASLDGQWTGAAKSPSTGNDMQFEVSVKDAAGTWRYLPPSGAAKAGPCLGRAFPLQVQSRGAGKVVFAVDGASVVAGCPTFVLMVELVDDKSLKGTFGDGRQTVLVRP